MDQGHGSCSLLRRYWSNVNVFTSDVAILVLIWEYLLYFEVLLMRFFTSTGADEGGTKGVVLDILYCLIFFSFPLFGLLADVCVGRYRAIMAGIILCFVSWIFSGIGFVVDGFYVNDTLLLFFYGLAYITGVCGYTSFKANIVQYNIDQLVGASADELSTIIYWHSASVPISFSIFQLVRCAIRNDYIFLVVFVSAGLSLFIVVVSHSLFKHKLENISLIKNPVKLIVRVLCYARKHKYPENRSALTYWEEEAPSRLDLGKDKYGGPFTEEEIEDVKTVFRMLPLSTIPVVGLTTVDEVYHWIMSGNQNIEMSYESCLISTEFGKFVTSVVFFLIYLLLFQPIFKRFIPRMLLRIGVGLVFAFCTTLSKTVIFLLVPSDTSSVTPFTSPFLIIPQFFFGIAFALIFAASLEFTVAQAPIQMRGMMVGMWLASMGVGYLININLKYVFQCKNEFMCTDPFYYVVKGVITLIFLGLYYFLSRKYKFRVREREINIHKIVEDHYQRYMTQKDVYEAKKSRDKNTIIIEEEGTFGIF